MDSDFHYYGTGTAARASGFNKPDSSLIANVAQYVDWFDSDYWSYWRMVDTDGKPVKNRRTRKQYRYSNPQMSIQTIGPKLGVDYEENIWNPFHFPPGNLPYSIREKGWRKAFHDRHVVRKTSLTKEDANKLCRPYSKFALDLIEDTLTKYRELSTATGSELEKLVAELVYPRVRCPIGDGRKLALYVLGMRMHILADTWAHQDFTGERNFDINSAGYDNDVKAKGRNGKFQDTVWTGDFWDMYADTDCAAGPTPEALGWMVCAGHAQMGHYPDYSWLTFKYPAGWLPKGKLYHLRDNPKEYNEAWSWLKFVMGLCNGSVDDGDLPDGTPKEITKVIGTWRKLSTEKFQAIAASEEQWKKTSLGKELPKRWQPARRAGLGLYDGLAKTRAGWINVKQNSILHYMETAASIHYQYCVDWMAANPNYSWVPWKPKT